MKATQTLRRVLSNSNAMKSLINQKNASSMMINRGASVLKMTESSTSSKANFSTRAMFHASAQPNATEMFCYQCEQTQNGTGCTTVGVCGKTPSVAALQDLLIYQTRQLCVLAHFARANIKDVSQFEKIDDFVLRAMYSTLTNVNFDEMRFVEFLKECSELTQFAKKELLKGKVPTEFSELMTVTSTDAEMDRILSSASSVSSPSTQQLIEMGKTVGVQAHHKHYGVDTNAIRELLQYGIKGLCAYTEEAALLGKKDIAVNDFIREAMCFLGGVSPDGKLDPSQVGDALTLGLKCGAINVRTMQLLDEGGNEKFGTPSPHKVRCTPVPGKSIVVSGHDMGDLLAILKQTEGKGINVYTHGELLPAHGYPELRKYKHLVGNYGGAWQNQKMEFSTFKGAIVMTTNCIIEPRKQYKDRIFTTSVVGWPGVTHIKNRDFTPVIEKALAEPGFPDEVANEPVQYTTTGFGHKTVLGIADIVINAVKRGDIKRFFLIGGCDGTEGERSYYKSIATSLPKDNVILTLGCAKYRFNKIDFGTITTKDPKSNNDVSLPRLLDVGQCNDAYSAVVIASALAEAFGTKDLNDLPLNFVISWFEQKAVVIFLTMLHLGLKNVRIGPNLPAFLPPSTIQMLVETFKLHPIMSKDPLTDLELMQKGQ
ncbi:hypothetical protein C9374_001217 [Naegleria lovaniensis]|uniref:Hydroxylamine reductase n=1 Tax=Naegleria lovaniensis TaxID=51637 RepID=A0AA88KMI4_NAELO|nr:uncharacterized protein C9374_001217 [Naegleria lovaniensis]KAG2387623.1 hypothetical protein C9374_001217 [Naegleria lovaniensis]